MSKRHFILLILLLLGFAPAYAASDTPKLDSTAYASVLTCGPGDELYETFGHSALRIVDSANGIDAVFNYGMFSFGEPHFYLKFFRGQLNYYVCAMSFGDFMLEYDYCGRSVFEQRLKLSSDELQVLFDTLCRNVLPENRYYKYDFFRDNCATRVRDIIETSLAGRSFVKYDVQVPATSFRDLIYKYTDSTLLWWRFGIDLLLGARCDAAMTTGQYMYIPMEMMTQYDTSLLADGTTLAERAVQLIPDKRTPMPKSVSPTMCFWVLFAIVLALSLLGHRKVWKLYWLDGVIYAAVGIVSLVLMYLWFFSDHWCAKMNLNLIWANPLFLWLLVRLRRNNTVVALIIGAILLVFLAGACFLPQHFNSAVLPIALTLAVRLYFSVRCKKYKE